MKKLFVIGDSISIHYGEYLRKLCEGRAEYARKRSRPEFAGHGLEMTDNGLDSAEVLKYAKYLNAQGLIDFDTLLLNCGLHDIKTTKKGRKVELSDYIRNLEETLKIFEAHSVKIIWVTTTPVNDEVHNSRHGSAFRRCNSDVLAYNAAARQIMQAHSIPVIDLYAFTLPYLNTELADHVHFSEKMRSLHANFIASSLGLI